MSLKRNGLGQLGFHIQSEGIVTEVEPYGFAWESGLRKGSRLVEICKVATTTLVHDQIVDLLRTSVVVKVVVVPPMEDGSPRGYIIPSSVVYNSSVSSNDTVDSAQTASSANQKEASRQSPAPSRGDSSLLNSGPLTSKQSPGPQRKGGTVYDSSPRPRTANAHGYSDSTLSSGRSSDDGRSSFFSHSRQESEFYGSMRSHEGHSSGDELQSRNNSHDSSDYALSAVSGRSRSSHHSQPPPLRRGEQVFSTDISPDGTIQSHGSFVQPQQQQSSSSAATSTTPSTGKRQFASMEYPSGIPATGNIALELLKQTQNTKYLLGQQNRHDSNPPTTGSSTNLSQISEGSSSSSSQALSAPGLSGRSSSKDDGQSRRKDGEYQVSKSKIKKGYTEPPVSSPRAMRRNLSGMSSEESLSSRLRPSSAAKKLSRQTARADFEAELMRLIDPDLSENDLQRLQSHVPPPRSSGRLQRTVSDESLHNSKGDKTEGTLEESPISQRLSPRAVPDLASTKKRSKSTVDNRALPLLESTAALDWTKLVSVASKAIDETDSTHLKSRIPNYRDNDQDDLPPPRPPSPQMSDSIAITSSSILSSYGSLASTPQQRAIELEQLVHQLATEVEKLRQDKRSLERENKDLRADNVRLQEESQTAATQLRRFTEWFFNTIDRQ